MQLLSIKNLNFLLLLFIFAERIPNTFQNKRIYKKFSTKKENFLCVFMTMCYIAILLTAFIQFNFSQSYRPRIAVLGFIIWLIGLTLRRKAIAVLGRSWSIYRTPTQLKKITTVGPYEFSRHPYYLASLLELFGYSFIFGSLIAFVLVSIIYTPLIILRILAEEKFLKEKFDNSYISYQLKVPLIFSLRNFFQTQRLFNSLKQIVKLIRFYGFRQLLNIMVMNRAVKRYFRNYIISQMITALDRIGFVDQLMNYEQVNLEEYCNQNSLNFPIFKSVCDYLHIVRILKKESLNYSISSYGGNLIKTSRGVFDFIHAYAPIFENLDHLISNKKTYGKDVFRRSEFVGRASAELAELYPFPIARFILSKHNLNSILDLGSGSGDFLIGFCNRHTGHYGYGIDISQEAVNYANKKAELFNVSDKVQFIQADILNLNNINQQIRDIDVITCMFVLHEFLSINEKLVLDVLSHLKSTFPGKPILICELTKCSVDHLHRFPSGVAEHHLFHYLSRQGLATEDHWNKIFSKTRYKVIDKERLNLAEQSIFLIQ